MALKIGCNRQATSPESPEGILALQVNCRKRRFSPLLTGDGNFRADAYQYTLRMVLLGQASKEKQTRAVRPHAAGTLFLVNSAACLVSCVLCRFGVCGGAIRSQFTAAWYGCQA